MSSYRNHLLMVLELVEFYILAELFRQATGRFPKM